MSFTSFLSDRSSSKLPPPQPDNPSAFLQTASFSNPQSTSQSSSSSPPSDSFSAESLFGGASTYDPAQLHPLAGLGSGKQLEYLTLEDDKTNLEGGAMMGNRGFMDDVQTGTGTAYVTGECSSQASISTDLEREERERGRKKQGEEGGRSRKKTRARADLSSLPSSFAPSFVRCRSRTRRSHGIVEGSEGSYQDERQAEVERGVEQLGSERNLPRKLGWNAW